MRRSWSTKLVVRLRAFEVTSDRHKASSDDSTEAASAQRLIGEMIGWYGMDSWGSSSIEDIARSAHHSWLERRLLRHGRARAKRQDQGGSGRIASDWRTSRLRATRDGRARCWRKRWGMSAILELAMRNCMLLPAYA